MNIKEKIGFRIKEIRMYELKINQDELAYRIGWDRSFLSRVESGKQNITIENLNALCNALNITLANFFSTFNIKIDNSENDVCGKESKDSCKNI